MNTTKQEPVAVNFIPETALGQLEGAVKRINRQAAKLGCEPVRFELTGKTEMRKYGRNKPPSFNFAGVTVLPTRRFVEVAVYGEQPKLPDWELVAVIDYREKLPIVKSVPGTDFEAGLAIAKQGAICDHCRSKRHRVDTFILRNKKTAELVQVGRQCLGDFLGLSTNDPERQLNWFIALTGSLDGFGEYDDDYCGGRGRPMISVQAITLIAAACVDQWGWVSKGRAQQEDIASTASKVAFIINPPPRSAERAYFEWKEMKEAVEERTTDAMQAEVKEALAWAEQHVEDESDYLRNLAVCAVSRWVGADKFGLVVSLIAAYRREQDRLKAAERKRQETKERAAISEHVGEVKVRQEMLLTLTEKPRAFESDFGVSYLCKFLDDAGNVVIWWASNDPTLESRMGWAVGDSKKVKATVKKHDEFNGVKQTMVNRVSAVA